MMAAALLISFPGGPSAWAEESAERTKGEDPPTGALPGAPPLPEKIRAEIGRLRKLRGTGYEPRTRHLDSDGWALYTNRLFLESSPYLLQHAHNPVNWYPWGEEAFAEARRRGVPVLLSVGYSTCHWCHVMEEESFEDEEIARYLNENYVAVKVDREERPDVDAVYMSAVQALTGGGGWPMTVWLDGAKRPFYGGTYFPPRDGDRGARAGFLTVLRTLRAAHDEQPERIAEAAAELVAAVKARLAPSGPRKAPPARVLERAYLEYESRYDGTWGGMDGAPKFPSSLPIRFLLRHHQRTGEARALEMAEATLERMAAGGMYDQVGGGFHRYATDREWLVPHFEKMLYDNARLAVAYLEGYQVTGREDFRRVAEEILRYVQRDMTSPEGAFYSATDADSLGPSGERVEGWFFTWTPHEIDGALGEELGRVVKAYYGVSPEGNFAEAGDEGDARTILHVPRPLPEVAKDLGLSRDRLRARVDEAREKLYAVRRGRPAPLRDEKILTAWNGLMISAYARAARLLARPEYAEAAERAASFVLAEMSTDEGRLRRSYLGGRARHTAYLDDYAFLIAGLLDLYEGTGNPSWLGRAVELDRVLERHYEDPEGGGFYMTADDAEELLTREKPRFDGAEPTGNSVHLLNLLRLHALTTDDRYRARADLGFEAFGATLTRSPTTLSEMLLAFQFRLDTVSEVVIVTKRSRDEADPFLAELRSAFFPNHVLVVVAQSEVESLAKLVPLVEGKVAARGAPTAYVCERGVCDLPTSDPSKFATQIRRKRVSPTAPERD